MTVNERGSRGEPVVSDPPTHIADFAAHANYAAIMGTRMVGTASQRTDFANTYGFSPYSGLRFYEVDTFNEYLSLSGGWVGVKPQAGAVAFTTGQFTAQGGGYSATANINFAAGRFTAVPQVTTGVYTTAPQDQHAGIANVTTSGFTLYYWRANLTATTVGWTATPTDS